MIGFALCSDLERDINHYLNSYAIERKFDGDRVHIVSDGKVKIYNRNFTNYTHRLPEIVDEVRNLQGVILDGEVVYLNGGKEDFDMVRRRCSTDNKLRISILSRKYPVTVKVFDILKIGGKLCTDLPYTRRKSLLEKVLREVNEERLSLVEYMTGREVLEYSKREGWEGVVLKKLNGRYFIGRSSTDWIRVKHFKERVMRFTQYEIFDGGIVLIEGEHRVAVNGRQSEKVKELIDKRGYVNAEIQFLQETSSGKLRMPTFRGLSPT